MTKFSFGAQTSSDLIQQVFNEGWRDDDVRRLVSVHLLMERLFSGRYRGSGRPFICHLAGTASLASRYGANVDVVLAAYAHAIYDQGEFGRLKSGASSDNRAEFRAAAGISAEAIVFHYSNFKWLNHLNNNGENLTAEIDKAVMFLRIVNLMDDCVDLPLFSKSKAREKMLSKLERSIGVMNSLGYPQAESDMEIILEQSNKINRSIDLFTKGSRTVHNPEMRKNFVLTFFRRLLN